MEYCVVLEGVKWPSELEGVFGPVEDFEAVVDRVRV